MYILIVYDIEVKRVTKVHKFLKRYLHWVQNSVFEGELSPAQIEEMKSGLNKIIGKDSDSILMFVARDKKWLEKEVIGKERGETGNVL
jgi:CRISPR-associated protein Cas2